MTFSQLDLSESHRRGGFRDKLQDLCRDGEGPFRKKSVSFRHRRKDCGLPPLSFERSIKRRRGGRVGSWAGAVTVVLELNTPNGKGSWCTYQLEFCTGEWCDQSRVLWLQQQSFHKQGLSTWGGGGTRHRAKWCEYMNYDCLAPDSREFGLSSSDVRGGGEMTARGVSQRRLRLSENKKRKPKLWRYPASSMTPFLLKMFSLTLPSSGSAHIQEMYRLEE